MQSNLTFNTLKELSKNISNENVKIEKLYIEQLENQSMSSDVNSFNILFAVNDLSFDDEIFDIAQKYGNVLAMFEDSERDEVIEYKFIFENLVQGIFRIVEVKNISILSDLDEKYVCIINKNQNREEVYIDNTISKLSDDDFLSNTCKFFWEAIKFGNKLSTKEILNISQEYRNMMKIVDEHLKHYVLSENKYVIDLGKDDKLVFNYVETEIFEKYLSCYSKLDLESLWTVLFNICALFRKLSLQIAINLRFEYAKELDRDTINYLRELRKKI